MNTYNHNNAMRIAYLNEDGLSRNGVVDSLRLMFPNASIYPVLAHEVDRTYLSKIDMLVLPGNNTEESPYPTFFPPHRIQDLKWAMETYGLVIQTTCAPSYYMYETISYETRDGNIKQKSGAGLIKGTAKQAFHTMTRANGKPDLMKDYIQAAVTSPLLQEPFHVLNVNGPSFHLHDTERHDCTEFIRYKHVDGAAGVVKRFDKGLLITLGIHPELSSLNSDIRSELSFPLHDMDRHIALRLIADIIKDHQSRKPWQKPDKQIAPRSLENV